MRTCASVLVFLLCCGCSTESQEKRRLHLDDLVERIKNVDVSLQIKEQRDAYRKRVEVHVRALLSAEVDPLELRDLIARCYKQERDFEKCRSQDNLTGENPFWIARIQIVEQLGGLKTEEAARVLVDLFNSDKIGWDGEMSLNLCRAISVCGRPCLPFLLESSGARAPLAKTLIAYIEDGRVYGP